MKFKVTVLFLVLMGIAASAWAQGGSVEKGKALVDSKKCALCHKEGSKLGKPMEMLAGEYRRSTSREPSPTPRKPSGPK